MSIIHLASRQSALRQNSVLAKRPGITLLRENARLLYKPVMHLLLKSLVEREINQVLRTLMK